MRQYIYARYNGNLLWFGIKRVKTSLLRDKGTVERNSNSDQLRHKSRNNVSLTQV